MNYKAISLLVFVFFFFSCKEKQEKAVWAKEKECAEWTAADSLAMEYTYMALQCNPGNVKKILVYYKYIATLDHNHAGMFSYTGNLYEQLGDTAEACKMYEKEITQDRRLLHSDKFACTRVQANWEKVYTNRRLYHLNNP